MSLQLIRDKSQGWFAWIIVTAICVTFALWGIHSYLYSNKTNSVIAIVNGDKITQQEFSSVYNQLKRRQQLQFEEDPSIPKHANIVLKNFALQSIVSSMILTQAANKNGFNVGDDLIETTITKIPIFQIDGVFSKERFNQIMHRMVVSVDALVSELRTNILINQVRSGIINTSFSLPYEIDQSMKLIQQKRKFNYIIIPSGRFEAQIKLPNSVINDYYQKHQKDFKIPEKISIEYLMLSIDHLSKQIHPTEQEIKAFYQSNLSNYTQPKQWKLAKIVIELSPNANQKQIKIAEKKATSLYHAIKNGKSFDSVAAKHSDSNNQAQWKSSAELNPDFRNALANLNINETSLPIKTPRGYELIKLLAIKPEKIHPFPQVKNKVFQMVLRKKTEQQFSNLSDQLANLTYENPTSLKPAAKQLGLTIQKTDFFTKEGTKKGIAQNPQVVTAAFDDEVLNQGNNSEPINLKDNTTIVLRILQHQPTAIKPFDSVKSQITRKLIREEIEKKAKELGNQLIDQLNTGKKVSTISQKNGLKWKSVNYTPRYDKNINLAILNAVFRMPQPKNSKSSVNAGVKLPSGNFAIISLKSIKETSKKPTTSPTYHVFKKQIETGLGLLTYQLYVNGLMENAKIVKKQEITE